jgi:hypothetical protein
MMAKIDKKHKLNKGGSQFTPEVALGPSSIMKGKAMLRNKKVKEPLKMDIASMKKRMW